MSHDKLNPCAACGYEKLSRRAAACTQCGEPVVGRSETYEDMMEFMSGHRVPDRAAAAAADALDEIRKMAAGTAQDSLTMLKLTKYVLWFTVAAVLASITQVVVALSK